uniref:Uncharacterized protein LOC101507133 n=1 Tax=Cicer arietinum TaxID=3827 RepID=A0A1S2XFB5_CICAR|nr:uncharacterized protein LOC101507133 [Cicer arietinum]
MAQQVQHDQETTLLRTWMADHLAPKLGIPPPHPHPIPPPSQVPHPGKSSSSEGSSPSLASYLVPLTNELDEPLHSTLYLLSDDKFKNRVKLDWPPPFHEDDSCIHILSFVAVNGMRGSRTQNVYFGTLLQINSRDDYKVIQKLVFFVDDNVDVPCVEPIGFSPIWEIYSLRSNSWRKLDVDMSYRRTYDELYMDGVCHWWSINDYGSLSNVGPCLLSFDLCNKVFLTTPFPSDMVDRFDILHLVLLNGSIAFIIYDKATTLHIRILGEHGVKES